MRSSLSFISIDLYSYKTFDCSDNTKVSNDQNSYITRFVSVKSIKLQNSRGLSKETNLMD